jgi:D-proline reductase (dithiol) PrdB
MVDDLPREPAREGTGARQVLNATLVLSDLGNRVAVQLFKRIPWLGDRWARRHRFVDATTIPWTPLRKPLAECVLALVTTAGVHVRTDPPFDMADQDGDPSFRIIPTAIPADALTITHRYYDHSAADRDLNVVLPRDRARELVDERRIAGLSPRVYSFMGHVDGPHLATLMERTGPDVARRLVVDGADAVFLTPA